MNESSDDMAEIALELFNPDGFLTRGHLRRRFAHSGTQAWGDELATGALVLFDELIVEPAFHRQGVGTSRWFAYAESPDHPSKHIDDSDVIEDPKGHPDYQSEGDPDQDDYEPEDWERAKESRIHPDDLVWDSPNERAEAGKRYWANVVEESTRRNLEEELFRARVERELGDMWLFE
ncbi:unnamed protein product [Discula destructiva]